jgi:hypothetical protein
LAGGTAATKSRRFFARRGVKKALDDEACRPLRTPITPAFERMISLDGLVLLPSGVDAFNGQRKRLDPGFWRQAACPSSNAGRVHACDMDGRNRRLATAASRPTGQARSGLIIGRPPGQSCSEDHDDGSLQPQLISDACKSGSGPDGQEAGDPQVRSSWDCMVLGRLETRSQAACQTVQFLGAMETVKVLPRRLPQRLQDSFRSRSSSLADLTTAGLVSRGSRGGRIVGMPGNRSCIARRAARCPRSLARDVAG